MAFFQAAADVDLSYSCDAGPGDCPYAYVDCPSFAPSITAVSSKSLMHLNTSVTRLIDEQDTSATQSIDYGCDSVQVGASTDFIDLRLPQFLEKGHCSPGGAQ